LVGFGGREDGLSHDVLEERHRDRLDTGRGWVKPVVAGKLPFQTKLELPLWGETWVRGPHSGERLTN
jgi:hypothetical protein